MYYLTSALMLLIMWISGPRIIIKKKASLESDITSISYVFIFFTTLLRVFVINWRAKGKFSKVRKVLSRKLQFGSKVYKMLKAVYLSILQRASNLHNLRPAIPNRQLKRLPIGLQKARAFIQLVFDFCCCKLGCIP